MDRRRKWFAAGAAAIVLLAAGVVVVKMRRPHFDGDINALGVDLSRPFAYVSTPALSRLPRDIVQAPVVRDVLTEDFAFYYEDQEDRLSLRGAIKRIAYERETTWTDQLLATALEMTEMPLSARCSSPMASSLSCVLRSTALAMRSTRSSLLVAVPSSSTLSAPFFTAFNSAPKLKYMAQLLLLPRATSCPCTCQLSAVRRKAMWRPPQ